MTPRLQERLKGWGSRMRGVGGGWGGERLCRKNKAPFALSILCVNSSLCFSLPLALLMIHLCVISTTLPSSTPVGEIIDVSSLPLRIFYSCM